MERVIESMEQAHQAKGAAFVPATREV